jgi:hypothetical protein
MGLEHELTKKDLEYIKASSEILTDELHRSLRKGVSAARMLLYYDALDFQEAKFDRYAEAVRTRNALTTIASTILKREDAIH